MRYEIKSFFDGIWTKVQWCADHGSNLAAARYSHGSLQAFLGRWVRLVAIGPDDRRNILPID